MLASEHYEKGMDHFSEDRLDEAIAEFEKAIVILPDDEGLHYNIARAQIEKGEWKLAAASIQEALKINPQFKEGTDLLTYIESNTQ